MTLAARAEDEVGATPSIRGRVKFLSEVKANVAYATTVALLLTMGLAVGEFASDNVKNPSPRTTTALVVAVLVHLLLTLLMVVRRTYRLISDELIIAATTKTPADR